MDWNRKAKTLLRQELTHAGVSYADLAVRLRTIGVSETERSIANKMSRGTFQFAFFLQCIEALGKSSVTLDWKAIGSFDEAGPATGQTGRAGDVAPDNWLTEPSKKRS